MPCPPAASAVSSAATASSTYEVTGAGAALVFAHGLGGNQLSWWQQVAHFAPRYTCITFAHRGFAPSSSMPGGPDPADFAGDLAALIDHLGLSNVCIVAQSMGGWTAVEYALQSTGKLQALVLASTTGTINPARIREPERAPHSCGRGRAHGREATGTASPLAPHRRDEC